MSIREPSGINAAAWLVWLVGASTFPLVTRNPLYLSLGFLVVVVVHLSQPVRGRSGRSWRLFAYVGSVVTGISIAFNLLTVHVGDREFASLPERLPIVGGALTLNALVYGAASALALSTLLFAAATFNSSVRHADLIRLLPGSLARFGVAGAIALTFIPAIIDASRDVYDAQRARGHRFRGPRDAPSFLGPLMTVGLERAVVLSEALETRGFGSSATAFQSRSRVAFLPAVLCLLIALPLIALGHPVPGLLAITGAVLVMLLLAPPPATRTRYRRLQWNRSSLAVAAAAAVAPLTVAVSLASGYSLSYEPFPRLEEPAFELIPGLAICLLILPAIVGDER